MAIKSMTGFGRAEQENKGRVWTAEVRCVNNRYLDLKLKLPKGYSTLEEKIRKKVNSSHVRGRVDFYLTVTGDFSDLQEIKVNLDLAKGYQEAMQQLAGSFGLSQDMKTEQLAAFPDVIIREQKEEDITSVWPVVERVVDQALDNCSTMRLQEGEALSGDLLQRLQSFEQTIGIIDDVIPDLVLTRYKQLQERLDKLLDNIQLDPARVTQEVAVLADKTDVTEEIVRLRSHIKQFRKFLTENGAVGRKLDFLLQEFLREVNTLASKINDAAIAHHTVDLKSELEKMREQVQNIE